MIDFIHHWRDRLEWPAQRLVALIGLARSKYISWSVRYGHQNRHNALVPRDHWLEEWERQAIIKFYLANRLDGYRRVTYRMLDANIVTVSPATVYRVLGRAGLLRKWTRPASKKGTGFVQPDSAHSHWHVDISYINVSGTFYYLCAVLDGYSRFIIHWELREQMTERDIEVILQRARELFPEARPRIISDHGPQFIARDFKEFIRLCGMTHVRTSPFYPQSNGKLERWHKSLKSECLRPKTPLSLEDAQRLVAEYVAHYNQVRLHSAIGYLAPFDKLEGRASAIFAERDCKLAAARAARKCQSSMAAIVQYSPMLISTDTLR